MATPQIKFWLFLAFKQLVWPFSGLLALFAFLFKFSSGNRDDLPLMVSINASFCPLVVKCFVRFDLSAVNLFPESWPGLKTVNLFPESWAGCVSDSDGSKCLLGRPKVDRRPWAPKTFLEFAIETCYVLDSWKTLFCPCVFSGVLETSWRVVKLFIIELLSTLNVRECVIFIIGRNTTWKTLI